MTLLTAPLAPNSKAIRSLGNTFLASSKEMISWQIDSTQSFVNLNSQLLKATLSGLAIAQEPEKLPEAIQSVMQNAIEITRDSLVATTDCQIEALRLLKKHSAESQKAFAETLSQQLNSIESAIPVEHSQGQKRRQAA